jgi:hypothetical protein
MTQKLPRECHHHEVMKYLNMEFAQQLLGQRLDQRISFQSLCSKLAWAYLKSYMQCLQDGNYLSYEGGARQFSPQSHQPDAQSDIKAGISNKFQVYLPFSLLSLLPKSICIKELQIYIFVRLNTACLRRTSSTRPSQKLQPRSSHTLPNQCLRPQQHSEGVSPPLAAPHATHPTASHTSPSWN